LWPLSYHILPRLPTEAGLRYGGADGSAMAMTLPVLNATALTESAADPVVTKYYFHGGKRVAMDREGVVKISCAAPKEKSTQKTTLWVMGYSK